MTAGYAELFLDQGMDFRHTIYLSDDVTNAAVNIYGYTVTSHLKRSYFSQNVSGNIICTIVDASNGEVQLHMNSANTSNLKAGRYVYDIITYDSGGTPNKVLEGIIHVAPTVTLS